MILINSLVYYSEIHVSEEIKIKQKQKLGEERNKQVTKDIKKRHKKERKEKEKMKYRK